MSDELLDDEGPAYAELTITITTLDEALDHDRAATLELLHTLWLGDASLDPATAVRVCLDETGQRIDGDPTHYLWGNVRLDNLGAVEKLSTAIQAIVDGPYVEQDDEDLMPPIKKATPKATPEAAPAKRPTTGPGSSKTERAKPDRPDRAARAQALAGEPRSKEDRDAQSKRLVKGEWGNLTGPERRSARRAAASAYGHPDVVIR